MVDPKFSPGDIVQRINQSEAIGLVREVRWDEQAENWNYLVQLGAQLKVVPQESLESFHPLTSVWDSFFWGRFSGYRTSYIGLGIPEILTPSEIPPLPRMEERRRQLDHEDIYAK